MKDVGAASELLQPYNARLCYPVSTRINSVAQRRSVLRTRGTRPDSESTFLVVGRGARLGVI
jgi:hypothetical protein